MQSVVFGRWLFRLERVVGVQEPERAAATPSGPENSFAPAWASAGARKRMQIAAKIETLCLRMTPSHRVMLVLGSVRANFRRDDADGVVLAQDVDGGAVIHDDEEGILSAVVVEEGSGAIRIDGVEG